MSMMQRTKGKAGEREVAALIRDLTGWDVRRRVRQHDGDSDLLGVPGWSIEVKNVARAKLADIERWWAQTVNQADTLLPLLVYKRQPGKWRAVWPQAVLMIEQRAEYWRDVDYTVEGSVAGWAAVARDLCPVEHLAQPVEPAPPKLGPVGVT